MESNFLFGIKLPMRAEYVQSTFSENDKKAHRELSELYFDNLVTIGAIQTTLDKTKINAKELNQELVNKIVQLTNIKDGFIKDNDVTLGLIKAIESRYQVVE